MSAAALARAAHADHWAALAFAGSATAVILAGAWVYAVIWARRERRRLAAERESRSIARQNPWPSVEPAGSGGDVLPFVSVRGGNGIGRTVAIAVQGQCYEDLYLASIDLTWDVGGFL